MPLLLDDDSYLPPVERKISLISFSFLYARCMDISYKRRVNDIDGIRVLEKCAYNARSHFGFLLNNFQECSMRNV